MFVWVDPPSGGAPGQRSARSDAEGRFTLIHVPAGNARLEAEAAGHGDIPVGAVVTDLRGGPWWNPKVGAPRINVVAAPRAQHATLLDLLSSLRTTVQTRR